MKKKPMFAISVSAATIVYNISFIILLIGTALVLFSATALIWSNSIRERDASERIAHLEAANTQSTAAAEKARADLAEANRLLAQANAATAAAEKQVAEAKSTPVKTPIPASGRVITPANRELFIDFVKTASKGRVVVDAIVSDEEATQFAHQVADMLQGAGYTVVENYGSQVLLGPPPTGVEMRIRSMEDQPRYAGSLQNGLEFVGIPTAGSLDVAAADAVILFVGTKP